MKGPISRRNVFKSAAALAVAGLSKPNFALAAGDEAENLVNFGRHSIQGQKTPDFRVQNVTEKRWHPKEWLEVEFPFKIDPPKEKKDLETYDSLTFYYYVYIENPDAAKRKILTAEITHVNVPVKEDVASVAYVSPSTLASLSGRKVTQVGPSLVSQVGVEVKYNGKLVGFFSTAGKGVKEGSFWDLPKAPPKVPGLLLSKNLTPFAPLWGDYHCDVQSK